MSPSNASREQACTLILREDWLPQAFERRLVGVEPMRVGLEAGTHSPWISRVLGGCGHEVLVANYEEVVAGGANE
jgi:transposase